MMKSGERKGMLKDVMEITIIRVLATYHPFSYIEIRDAFIRLKKSYDTTITAINRASTEAVSLYVAVDRILNHNAN